MSAPLPTAAAAGMRCFLALLPDADGVRSLRQSRAALEAGVAGAPRSVRWSAPEAWHLTLRFLGSSSAAQVDHFRRAVPQLATPLPAIPARRHAIWPNRSRPRLLVLELEAVPRLAGLARACEASARDAGFAPEPRGFRAHVTLARLRPGCAFGILPAAPVSLTFGAIALMQSTLAPSGSTYIELVRSEVPRSA